MKIVFRTSDGHINTGDLEFEGERVFVVLYTYGPKGTTEIIGRERMELERRFLQKVMDPEKIKADFIYKSEVQLPDPGKN